MMTVVPSVSVARRGMSLALRFALAGGFVMFCATLAVGYWVTERIEMAVVRNSANATAQYMESFISPLSQDLASADEISPGAHRALDEVFQNTALGERVVSYKIWKQGGRVVDASDHEVLGQTFEVSEGQAAAWRGEVDAKFDDLTGIEDAAEAAMGLPLLEIYSPIREVWSGRVIGVVEFYEVAHGLEASLVEARRRSWAAVAAVMLAIFGSLYGIVLQGSRTIDRQVEALRALGDHNTALRMRVQAAAARSAAMHDAGMRQLGADLHDGPAQLMGFVALRLDGLGRHLPDAERPELDEVRRAVQDAIREVRAISRGVALPDIAARDPCDILRGVIEAMEARSGQAITLDCVTDGLPPLDPAAKTCIYRFAQEGLTNAWRHAAGQQMALVLRGAPGRLVPSVLDRGPGFPDGDGVVSDTDPEGGMGLAGLRDRVEALGGTFETLNRPQGGAELRMTLEITT